jgi:hypothetical protein
MYFRVLAILFQTVSDYGRTSELENGNTSSAPQTFRKEINTLCGLQTHYGKKFNAVT